MKIVILDGYTLNPGDLSWESLEALGDVDIYPRTKPEDLLPRAEEAEILITNDVGLPPSVLKKLTKLKYICVIATGYDGIDLAQASRQGIMVSNSPGYSTYSVSQSAIALLLHLTQHIKDHDDAVKRGEWERSEDVCFWNYPLVELFNKKMGIIGMGSIGQQTARIAEAMGMEIQAYSPRPKAIPGIRKLSWVSKEELFASSDVISLHCPLSKETEHIISNASLDLMKKSALIINTARGKLIDEQALAAALNAEKIAGAGLDVLSTEPPKAETPLLKAKNCCITPHNAWATREARRRLMEIAVRNITAYQAGQPIHVLNQ
ncbi:MAG: D-2-hydroxyacid dehydrogenase [Spirochaetia bacterium]|nr:D-2-hydroxyacid dehydrogenase [Spirochaetia bacterium]